MQTNATRGAPRRGRRDCAVPQRARPCGCVATQRRSRRGARSQTRGRGAARPTPGQDLRHTSRRDSLRVDGVLHRPPLFSRAGRPPQLRRLHGLSHAGMGTTPPTPSPHAGWRAVSPQRRDHRLLSPAGRTATGLPIPDVYTGRHAH